MVDIRPHRGSAAQEEGSYAYRATLRAGFVAVRRKREGDGATISRSGRARLADARRQRLRALETHDVQSRRREGQAAPLRARRRWKPFSSATFFASEKLVLVEAGG
jgi:hypothetical protein